MITNRVPPQFGIITSCAYAESQTCALKVVTSDSHCENTQQNLGLPVAHMGLWWFGMNFQSFLCPACHRLKFKCGGKLEVLEAHPHSLLSAKYNFLLFYISIYIYLFFFFQLCCNKTELPSLDAFSPVQMGSTLYVCYKENGCTSSPFPSRDLDCLASLPTTTDRSSSTFTILA